MMGHVLVPIYNLKKNLKNLKISENRLKKFYPSEQVHFRCQNFFQVSGRCPTRKWCSVVTSTVTRSFRGGNIFLNEI